VLQCKSKNTKIYWRAVAAVKNFPCAITSRSATAILPCVPLVKTRSQLYEAKQTLGPNVFGTRLDTLLLLVQFVS
jgi:hypothetical protein